MSNLIPTHASQHVLNGLSEYLATSFSLAEQSTANSLKAFLTDPDTGMFHGPYVRTRLPYEPATNWEGSLPWLPDNFIPYRHQAEAFRRLASQINGQPRTPQPTLVVTGTGSGKTESFLYPILNHCLSTPGNGIKALILYPMNALANDQAARLADLITTDPRLKNIRAGLYTGEATKTPRRTVTGDGLITDRETIRKAPPEILLTNYKMLDQLLLRGADQPLWEASATTLQYVALDEFHTYDGAQGTDVALLLRRMGMKLKSLQPAGFLNDAESARPLGRITPVATSATLGDNTGEPAEMLRFAHTIFGEELSADAVVRETTLSYPRWQEMITEFVGGGAGAAPTRSGMPSVSEIQEINRNIARRAGEQAGDGPDEQADFAEIVHREFCKSVFRCAHDLNSAVLAAAHSELFRRILEHTTRPVALMERAGDSTPDVVGEAEEDALTRNVFPTENLRQLGDGAGEFLAHALTELAYLRAEFGKRHGWHGKKFPGVETHLWVREVSRIDRRVELDATGPEMFRWSDDGTTSGTWLPACFCRNCGRSGWMAAAQPADEFLETTPRKIRRLGVNRPTCRRPLIDASSEAKTQHARGNDEGTALQWLNLPNATLSPTTPSEGELDTGGIVPVLTYAGEDAEALAEKDVCPSCGEPDAIRYLGSSVATLLSVAVSNLFGMDDLASDEKKSLVFVDSVQDAAHRAGFMQSRARTFAFRTRTAAVVTDRGARTVSLAELPQLLIDSADRSADRDRARFELLPPWVTENPAFRPFWDPTATPRARAASQQMLHDVLALDVALEFGDRADLARSLVSTGTLSVGVDVPTETLRRVTSQSDMLPLGDSERLVAWARGIVEYMRLTGGVYTPLLKGYIEHDGNTFLLNRRESGQRGIPTFPLGGAPRFPRQGKPLSRAGREDSTLPIAAPRGWFARWTAKQLGISASEAARCCGDLFDQLAEEGDVRAHSTASNATMYSLDPTTILVGPEADHRILECSVCHRRFGVNAGGREILAGTPCHSIGCEGSFQPVKNADNYYRQLYSSRDVRTVISREHTSLLPTKDRLRVEEQFKASGGDQAPDGPNVLVATPTLEMGIDIGDLSTVVLASLPNSVASYVQRVGRAGRLSGNSLVIAVIRGRGKALARLERPLETIAGTVQPPAAFLSAREILQRQFIAYLLDTMDLEAAGVRGHRATSVFDGSGEASVIDAIVTRIGTGIERPLAEFISSLALPAGAPVIGELREWAETELTAVLEQKRQEWLGGRALLRQRRKALLEAREELVQRERTGSGDDETMERLRSTKSALKFVHTQLDEQYDNEPWISALERCGLLPNFTLLDDAVEFHVSVSRSGTDGEVETTTREYSRGIASGLFEMAPGATFYVQGIAARVDSVELGPNNANVQQWRLCPRCSYSQIEQVDSQVRSCPRCNDAGFADTSQVLNVVEMSKVYASVDYARSAITDATDDRAAQRFERTVSMIVPPGGYGRGWYLENTGFGVQYLPKVELRWLNLGRPVGGGRHTLCGEEIEAPQFRMCRQCGHLDSRAGKNDWRDHKPWCPKRRRGEEEDAILLALGRRLNTQGVLMHLPPEIAAADNNAMPSLIAALRMGFKLALGGNPNHLDVTSVFDSSAKGVSQKLLLHDSIPGGTGYLEQFQSPEDIRVLLMKVYEQLLNCGCRNDQRAACPDCLLPYTYEGEADKTSRETALGALTKILLDEPHPESGAAVDVGDSADLGMWTNKITEEEPEASARSKLESRFLEQLRADLKHWEATVVEKTVGNNARWTITFPKSKIQWVMEEQKDFGFTRPDFYFSTSGAAVDDIALYLDGAEFHASATHYSVAEDMTKRRRLARRSILPWSMTMHDLNLRYNAAQGIFADTPPWFVSGIRAHLNTVLSLQDDVHSLLLQDPMTQLLEILREPLKPWKNLGAAAVAHAQISTDLNARATQQPRPDGEPPLRTGTLSPRIDFINRGQHSHLSLIVVDREPDQTEWNRFLTLGNLVFLADLDSDIDVLDIPEPQLVGAATAAGQAATDNTTADEAVSSSATRPTPAVGSPTPAVDAQTPGAPAADEPLLSPAWRAAVEEWGENEGEAYEALVYLAHHGVTAPNDIGEEMRGNLTVARWIRKTEKGTIRVALVEELSALSGAEHEQAEHDDAEHDDGWLFVDASKLLGQSDNGVPEEFTRLMD
ncbi:DEAD/DEAH box helicase [Corynebacterium heidelbergense]|uniref:DEAD/DEAH box helicase n=1 Tax=Corynebacterium heidelbergense TaxID=2055947 RepID=A0A364V6D4_9CORY|nr:DEAD/DEAH box helicase [Corynebacterium heidelbergense]RAV32166.1 hypothetical protein DLJ54_04620 [Corynebacterium heidelbergense]